MGALIFEKKISVKKPTTRCKGNSITGSKSDLGTWWSDGICDTSCPLRSLWIRPRASLGTEKRSFNPAVTRGVAVHLLLLLLPPNIFSKHPFLAIVVRWETGICEMILKV